MKKYLMIFHFWLICNLSSFATDYLTIPNLWGDALEGAKILESKYNLPQDSLQIALDLIRNQSTAEAHYLLGVIYNEEGGRYGRFYDILSEEYDNLPVEPGYEYEVITLSEKDLLAPDPESFLNIDFDYVPYYRRGYDYYFTYIQERAFDEFCMSADAGFGPALNNVAYRYANGIGVGRDSEKAMYYYEKAATQGDAGAFANLGVEYLFGGGLVDYNYDKAFYWLDKAYTNGMNTDYVSLCLGYCYEKGLGTEINIPKAVSIYESTSHNEYFYNALGCNIGNFSIPTRLAILYYSNSEVLDYDKAFKYLKFVSDENVQEVGEVRGYILRCLSACYRFGRGVKSNDELADFYLRKAGDHGNIDAERALKYINEQ